MKALILAASLMALAHPAYAQGTQCGPREEFLQILRERYGETRQVHGLSSVNGALTEFYASTETGTWSIIVTIAGGESCLVADGVYFEREDNDPAPSGDPA